MPRCPVSGLLSGSSALRASGTKRSTCRTSAIPREKSPAITENLPVNSEFDHNAAKRNYMEKELIIIGQISLCSFLMALIVVFLNHLSANTRERKKERLQKGNNLIAAFSSELDALHQTSDDCRNILTIETYKRHESTIRAFLSYLSWMERFRLKRAWHRLAFHRNDTKGTLPFYEQYADFGFLDKRRSVRPIVIKRIEKILSFAK
jgi:hypothetical protein